MGERPLLGEVLVQAGLIDDLQLARALGEQKRWGGRLGLALLRLGFVTEEGLLRTLSNQLGVPAVRLGTKRVAAEVLDLLSAELAEKYRCIPLFVKREAGRELLHLGMEDPTDLAAIDDVSFRTGRRVRPVLIGPDELRRCLARFYRESDPEEGEDDLPATEEPPAPAPATAPEPSAHGQASPPPPPDDPTIVAAAAAVPVPDAAETVVQPPPQADFEDADDGVDPDFVPEETLAQGMDSAAAESGATTSFSGAPDMSSPEWADEDGIAAPPESPEPVEADAAWTDAEPMSESDLPSASPSSTLLDEIDAGDSLDIDVQDDAAEAAAPEDETPEPEDLSSRHLSHPDSASIPIPPEDPQDSGMLLPLEEEEPGSDDLATAATHASADATQMVDETLIDEASLGLDDLEAPEAPEPFAGGALDVSDPEAAAPEPDAVSLEDAVGAPEPDVGDEPAAAETEPGLASEDSGATLAPEPEPVLAPEVEAASADPAAAASTISTRDVLRALTELLVEKGILEPSELLERVRASREGNDPS